AVDAGEAGAADLDRAARLVHAHLDAAVAAEFATLARAIAVADRGERAARPQMRRDRGIRAAGDRILGDAVGRTERAHHQRARRIALVAAAEHAQADRVAGA